MERNDSSLREAFAKIKKDMDKHSDKISKLASKSKKPDKFMLDMRKDLLDLKKNIELLKKELLAKDRAQKKEFRKIVKEMVGEVKKPTLKTKFIQRFDRNKKHILTKKILDLISERQLTLPGLKTLVVDELAYCSKASFYRHFNELKRRKLIDFIELNGAKILVLVKQKPKLS